MDRFGPGWARCTPMASILRPTSLSWIYTITVEGLSIYETSQVPSEGTKTALEGEDFCYFRGNIGMNWQGEEVVLPS